MYVLPNFSHLDVTNAVVNQKILCRFLKVLVLVLSYMYGICVVEDFYQHIKLYSGVSTLDLSAAISFTYVHIRGLFGRGLLQQIKLYNSVKKALSPVSNNTFADPKLCLTWS